MHKSISTSTVSHLISSQNEEYEVNGTVLYILFINRPSPSYYYWYISSNLD